MTNPFSGVLLNATGEIKPKPQEDVKPRAIPSTQVVPFVSQISAPGGNYTAPEDVRPVEREVGARPCCSAIVAPTENHQQPDTEAKQALATSDAKPVYLKLKRDEATPVTNPSSIYITSGVPTSDPQKSSGKFACPIDGSPLTIVGSQHGAWICQGLGHQWDISNTAPVGVYVVSLTLPLGNAAGDSLGNQNL
jgi:hypothetical protein